MRRTGPQRSSRLRAVAVAAIVSQAAAGAWAAGALDPSSPSMPGADMPGNGTDALRSFLKARGISYGFVYTGEVLGNATGGIKRGASYEGQLAGAIDVDLGTLVGLTGVRAHANFYQNHGRGLTGNNTLDLFTVSSLEAYPSTKLYEAWIEDTLADGRLAIKAGQIGADTEFFVSQAATVFYNPTFGAPALLANDLPSGGPTYPLATPAARLKAKPTDSLSIMAALFDGDPAGPYVPGRNDPLPQIRDGSGTSFRIKDPPFLLTEAAFAYGQGKDEAARPGTIKVGLFHHFGLFAANEPASGPPDMRRGDGGVYGLIDQRIYGAAGGDGSGIAVFLRGFVAPSDRNLIDRYVDGGVSISGVGPVRVEDTFGVAFAYARIAPSAAAPDLLAGRPFARDFQTSIEATYKYAVRPNVAIQPEFQYIVHPGAHGVVDPATGRPIRDAAVFGCRVTLRY